LETANELVHLLTYATGTRGFNDVAPRARVGRRPGTVKDPNFQEFVSQILILTQFKGKGLTLEKNIGTGTVIEAIDALARYLPPGFVPAPLPIQTLQRVKADCSKAFRQSDQMDRTRPDGSS
jgi:hypothetical protein